jgi:hypothetical protein
MKLQKIVELKKYCKRQMKRLPVKIEITIKDDVEIPVELTSKWKMIDICDEKYLVGKFDGHRVWLGKDGIIRTGQNCDIDRDRDQLGDCTDPPYNKKLMKICKKLNKGIVPFDKIKALAPKYR